MILTNGTDLRDNSAALGGGLFWDVRGGRLSDILGDVVETSSALLQGIEADLMTVASCANLLNFTATEHTKLYKTFNTSYEGVEVDRMEAFG